MKISRLFGWPLLAFLSLFGLLSAATLPDSTPIPEFCVDGPRTCPENFGYFEITDSAGNPVHELRVNDFILMRYIEPPDDFALKPNRPGRDFHLMAPDLDGTGPESWVSTSSVVRIFNDDIFANILFSDDVDLQAPDREGPPDATYNPNGKRGWKVWHGENGPFGPGTLYQKTLKLENVPEYQANRWLFMDTGYGQQWPLSFQQFPLLGCGPATTDQEEYQFGDTITVTVQVSSRRNAFNGRANTYTDVTLIQSGGDDTLRLISGPTPAEIASLPPETTRDFVFTYEAIDDGAANLQFQAKGTNPDGDVIFSQAYGKVVFVGGRGDLVIRDLQRSSQPNEFGAGNYTPDDPISIRAPAPTNRGALFDIEIVNSSDETLSYRLKLAESAAENWNNDYFLEGENVGTELRSGGGLLVSDIPAGGSKTIRTTLKPGSLLAEECLITSARFTLSLNSGEGGPLDAIIARGESVFSELNASLTSQAVAGSDDLFELTLSVKNDSEEDARSVASRIPVGSSGEGTFEFAGPSTPNFIQTVAPGATVTFKRTLRRLTPGKVVIEAAASGIVKKANTTRLVFSNRAAVDLDGGDPEFVIVLKPDRPYLPEEVFAAILKINHQGDAPKTYEFPGEMLTAMPDGFVMIGEAEKPEPFTLTRENRTKQFTISLKAEKRGKTTLNSTLTKTDEAGEAETLTASKKVLIRALEAEVKITPKSLLLNQTSDDEKGERALALNRQRVAEEKEPFLNLIEIEMKVTNMTDEKVEGVKIDGLLNPRSFITNTNPSKPGKPITPVRCYPPEGDPIDLTMPIDDAEVAEVDLAKGESATFVWLVDSFDQDATEGVDNSVDLKFEALATGSLDGTLVKALGKEEFSVVDRPFLEWGMLPGDGRVSYLSGSAIRSIGTIENISARDDNEGRDLVVMVYQRLKGNVGGGYVTKASAAKTPDYYEVFELPSEGEGKKLELSAVMRSMPALKPTTATVGYYVRVWVKEKDGSLTNVDSQSILKEGWQREYEVSLSSNKPVYSYIDDCVRSGVVPFGLAPFYCNFEDKFVNEFFDGMRGLVELTGQGFYEIFGNLGPTIIAAEMRRISLIYGILTAEPGAFDSFLQELYVDYRTYVNLQVMAGNAITKAPEAFDKFAIQAGASLGGFFQAVENGDLGEIQARVGAFLGENPDMLIEAFVLAKGVNKLAKATALERELAENVIEKEVKFARKRQADSLDARLAAGRADSQLDNLAKKLLPGDALTANLMRDIFGVDAATLDKIKDVAVNNGVIIALRSRNPISIQLIRDLVAWPKPAALPYKTVNRIDTKYLGYRNQSYGLLEIVEPPQGIAGKVGKELDSSIDAYMETLRGKKPELAADKVLFAEVKERLRTRAKEWNEYVPDLVLKPENAGEGFSKIKVNFGAEKQLHPNQVKDFARDKGASEIRRVRTRRRLNGSVDPVTNMPRRTWELAMEGAEPGSFRGITGDIDFMAILDPSGGLIAEAATRIKVYHQLAAIGMQHGESFSFVYQNMRQEFLRCCVDGGEAMAVISPLRGESARAGFFVDNTSILKNNKNAGFLSPRETSPKLDSTGNIIDGKAIEIRRANPTGEFVMLDGIPYRTRFDLFFRNRFYPDILDDLFRDYLRLRSFFLPSFLSELLTEDSESASFSRDPAAPIIQAKPGSDSGSPIFERWQEGTGWEVISVDQAVELGGAGILDLAPMTNLPEGSKKGARRVEITPQSGLGASGEFFQPGDLVVINPGGDTEEIRTVVALGSLVFNAPLSYDHQPGEMVASLGPNTADSDGDGLSGLEEVALGTDPSSADTDRDGFSDGEEVARGTDPLVASSGLSIVSSVFSSDGNLRLEWFSANDRTYTVEASSSMKAGSWEVLGMKTSGDGDTEFLEIPSAQVGGKRFFRVRIHPLDDPDADGLSDSQEFIYGTMPDNPDSDGDGMNDGAEVRLGTDPADSDSIFRVTAVARDLETGELNVTFDSAGGYRYLVEVSNFLEADSWTTALSLIASGSITQVAIPVDQARQFLRVKAIPELGTLP